MMSKNEEDGSNDGGEVVVQQVKESRVGMKTVGNDRKRPKLFPFPFFSRKRYR